MPPALPSATVAAANPFAGLVCESVVATNEPRRVGYRVRFDASGAEVSGIGLFDERFPDRETVVLNFRQRRVEARADGSYRIARFTDVSVSGGSVRGSGMEAPVRVDVILRGIAVGTGQDLSGIIVIDASTYDGDGRFTCRAGA